MLLAASALAIWCFSSPSERRKRSLLCLPFALTTIALIGMSSDAAPPSAPQLSLRCPGDTSRITRGQILIDLDPACRKLSRPECHPIYHSTVDTALRFYPTLTLGADHHPAFLDFESAYPTHVGQCAKKQARLPPVAMLEAELWQRVAASRQNVFTSLGCGADETLAQYGKPFAQRLSAEAPSAIECAHRTDADLIIMRLSTLTNQLADLRVMLSQREGWSGSTAVIIIPKGVYSSTDSLTLPDSPLSNLFAQHGLALAEVFEFTEEATTASTSIPGRPPPPGRDVLPSIAIVAHRSPA